MRKKDKNKFYHHGIEPTTYIITSDRLTTWAIWPVAGSGVKLQYNLAHVHALLKAHA